MDDSDDESRIRAQIIDHPARAAAVAQAALYPLINPADWGDTHAPLRVWAWRDWMLANSATYLTGAGSAGKSLLGQQLCTHVALGRPYLGVEVLQGVALYVTCEDDADELHRRQESINEVLSVEMQELSCRLHLVSLVGEIGNELATFDPSNRMTTTPAWERLRATIAHVGASFLVLDNVAHLFAGNENIRAHVAGFCGLMNSLAAEFGVAVLFIGHPNKAGDSFSGSTAWENQVRSRLFLERDKGGLDSVADTDARTLSRGKANYARHGESISFRWYRGCFVLPEEMPTDEADALSHTVRLRAEEERFVQCLTKATSEGRATSTSRNAANYAPRLFAAMPTAQGMSAVALSQAMERLLDGGAILDRQFLWNNDRRQPVRGLAPTSAAGHGRGDVVQTL